MIRVDFQNTVGGILQDFWLIPILAQHGNILCLAIYCVRQYTVVRLIANIRELISFTFKRQTQV